jgi:hypothetical protein
MSTLMLFLDGVGLGPPDPSRNPFAAVATPTLDALAFGSWTEPRAQVGGGHAFAALDATLGAAGLPQSATGQAALLTGRDAVAAMGRPYGPWPGPTLKRFLAEGELFGWALERHGPGAAGWAGAYPPGFFAALEAGRLRLNALAHAARVAGVVLPDLEAYRRGDAVAADLDGGHFASLGVEPPGGHRPGPAGAERAGRRLAELAARRAFTLLDVWWTDHVGHAARRDEAADLVARLDAFLHGLLDARPASLDVLLVSDHGNLEDLSHGRHTRTPVPLAVRGPSAGRFAHAASLVDVAPALVAGWDAA